MHFKDTNIKDILKNLFKKCRTPFKTVKHRLMNNK